MPSRRQIRWWIGVAVALALLVTSAATFCAYHAVVWARGLPGRFQGPQPGVSLNELFAAALRGRLTGADVSMKLQTLHSLHDGMQNSPELAQWIKHELYAELNELTESSNPRVASAARDLVEQVDRSTDPEPISDAMLALPDAPQD